MDVALYRGFSKIKKRDNQGNSFKKIALEYELPKYNTNKYFMAFRSSFVKRPQQTKKSESQGYKSEN